MKEIKVYTTSYCGFCVAAKRLLGKRGYAFEEINLDDNPQLREQISSSVGNYRTVPMIFIGGFDQLAALDRSGRLEAKLAAPSQPGQVG